MSVGVYKEDVFMKIFMACFAGLFFVCIILGFTIGLLEKEKGWVKGHKPYGVYEKYVKRPLDFAIALFLLILLWPILAVIALVVRINMGSPIVFEQERPGIGGRVFRIKKFRSMTDARDQDGNLLPDDKRLTKFGRMLRASSLDEILELFCIIKGELSFVGPRPLLVEYLDRYSEVQKHRHDVRPGLTGYAQTEGRNLCSWNERFNKDLEYVNRITFAGDLRIVIKTIGVVLKREGVSSTTSVTMEAFTGNDE